MPKNITELPGNPYINLPNPNPGGKPPVPPVRHHNLPNPNPNPGGKPPGPPVRYLNFPHPNSWLILMF